MNRESTLLYGGSASTWHQKVPLGGRAERSATRAGRSQDKELQKIESALPRTRWCSMSPHFLTRRVSRLLGWLQPVLVPIALSFAFHISVFLHSLFFT